MLKPQSFSLIEISIVMTIIAVIVSAITVANNLINNAKSKQLISELNNYVTAINNFQQKYNYLPGDFPGAVNILGCVSCNGNGNGLIDNSISSSPASNEGNKFWQHLSLANLVVVNYISGSTLIIGSTLPKLSYSPLATLYADNSNNQNLLWLTAVSSNQKNYNIPVITNLDLYNIDLKIDDGLGNSGAFTAGIGDPNANTITASCPFTATAPYYDLANASKSSCIGSYIW